MTAGDLRNRQASVTEEPFAVGPGVRGRELATIRRRAAGIAVDAVLWLVVGTPIIVAVALAALYLQTPTLARALVGQVTGEAVEEPARVYTELLALVERRRPGLLPERFGAPLARGDLETVEERVAESPFSVTVQPEEGSPSWYDRRSDHLHVHRDVLFGPLASLVSYAVVVLAYTTLTSWLGGGRTPGKWVTGTRIARLDGEPLGLWDAFGRAGGYAASLSTLGLGFLEVAWDPNRQALHDRVARTVVLRDPGKGIRARLRSWRRRRTV